MLCIENVTRNSNLVNRGRVADNFWLRFRGLTFVHKLEHGQGLLITQTNSVHTHFMFLPIDILFVSKNNVVIDIVHALKPWRILLPRLKANYVVELPAFAVAKSGTQIGDQLQLFSDALCSTSV